MPALRKGLWLLLSILLRTVYGRRDLYQYISVRTGVYRYLYLYFEKTIHTILLLYERRGP
jgi:hypothetical protein